jgi:hypothetical protein
MGTNLHLNIEGPAPAVPVISSGRQTQQRAWRTARDIIASFLWTFLFVKLFVYDIDVFLVRLVSPTSLWLLDYKFFLIVGVVLLVWTLSGTKRLLPT